MNRRVLKAGKRMAAFSSADRYPVLIPGFTLQGPAAITIHFSSAYYIIYTIFLEICQLYFHVPGKGIARRETRGM